MELIKGITKIDGSDFSIYYIETISDELKQEIRSRLVAICHGMEQVDSKSKIYSYKATVKEFIKRYKANQDNSEDRKKGMIGELLVHILLEIEGRFITSSPYFNMEERSFRKGYDVVLFEENTNLLWIAEVKSGQIQKKQKRSSTAAVSLINTAKNDLNTRLNEENQSLWLNALAAARSALSSKGTQKNAVIKLLEKCASDSVDEIHSSKDHNVILAGVLFHPITEKIEENKIKQKQSKIVEENIFKKTIVMAIQKSTFEAVFDFLEGEAKDEE